MPAPTNQYKQVADELKANRLPQRSPISWFFVVFMAALTVLFVTLGYWQVQRLEYKLALIAAVSERASLDPVALPPMNEWEATDPEIYNFRKITVTGHFVSDNGVCVFTALTNTRGKFEGPGFWVMAPFALDGGGTIIVNRGFIPQSAKALFDNAPLPEGTLTLRGIARISAEPNGFTPGPDLANRIEYVRSIERLQALMSVELAPFVELYIDVEASGKGVLPQGGETVMTFRNRHLEYALTWFALAAITPLMTLIWLWRQRRP